MSRRWRVASRPLGPMAESEALSGDLREAMQYVTVPSYVVDKTGVVRWQNPAAIELFGDLRAKLYTSAVAPEDIPRARRSSRARSSARFRSQTKRQFSSQLTKRG